MKQDDPQMKPKPKKASKHHAFASQGRPNMAVNANENSGRGKQKVKDAKMRKQDLKTNQNENEEMKGETMPKIVEFEDRGFLGQQSRVEQGVTPCF